MIKTTKVNGVNVAYAIADPRKDDIAAAVGMGKSVKEIGQAEAATVAANFNYFDTSSGIPIGRVIAGGKTVIRDIAKTLPRDELYMLDGALRIGKAPAGAEWALQGSPPLLKDEKNVIAEGVKRDQLGEDIWQGSAYRLAAGITADGRLVVVRTLDKVKLDALASVMAALGCVDALNGDGGGSAYLWPSDNGWGRKMGAALIIKEGQGMSLIGDSKPELVIDPGHGGTDPGASGNGIIEKHMTLDISLYQYKRFKELGVPVALTRDSDISLDSTPRSSLVKGSGAKYCISNHINAAPSASAAGAEIIHSIYNDGKLAKAIAQALAATGQVLRSKATYSRKNDAGGDYYYMHRNTGSVSTVIVEYGFCSNTADAGRLIANWKVYAEAVVKAYCEFAGRKYTAPVTAPPKPEQPSEPVDDVTGHWAEAAIRQAIADGILAGFPDGTFRPDEPLTRAQLAAVLQKLK
jgi:N-acetylmuramoyl-L-alanine amidase